MSRLERYLRLEWAGDQLTLRHLPTSLMREASFQNASLKGVMNPIFHYCLQLKIYQRSIELHQEGATTQMVDKIQDEKRGCDIQSRLSDEREQVPTNPKDTDTRKQCDHLASIY